MSVLPTAVRRCSVNLWAMKPEQPSSDGHSRFRLAEFNGGEVTAELCNRWPFADGEVGAF